MKKITYLLLAGALFSSVDLALGVVGGLVPQLCFVLGLFIVAGTIIVLSEKP